MGPTIQTGQQGKNLWPYAIIGTFAVFITAMVTWIVFATQQDMELVGSNYYEREILYQREIDAAARARSAGGASIAYDFAGQKITLRVPPGHVTAVTGGKLELYRPNNARLDHTLPLSIGPDGTQVIQASALAPGLWKLRLSWRVNDHDYLVDQSVVIGSNS